MFNMKLNLKFLLLLAVLLPSLLFAGISVNNYTISKSSYQPGEPGVVSVGITNPTGSGRVEALTLSTNSPSALGITSSPSLADISLGGSTIVTVPFVVRSDARAGIYLLDLSFSGISFDSSNARTSATNTVSIPIIVVRDPVLSFALNDTNLGDISGVRLTISNVGGVAKELKISSSGDVSLANTNQVFVPLVTNSSDIDLKLDSRKASAGSNDLVFLVSYKDELGDQKYANYSLRVNVRKKTLDLSFSQKSDVVTGQTGNLVLTIKNNGNSVLKNVRLSFNDPSVQLKDRSEINFGDIVPSASADSSVAMQVNLAPGLNPVNSTLRWSEEDTEKESDISFPLTVTSDADVGIYLEAKPSPLLVGTDHTISVLVSNLGSYAINNVDVGLSSVDLKSLDVSGSQFIGSLNKDDFSTVQFKMRVPDKEGQYNLDINIRYKDLSGEWKTKNFVRPINVYSAPASGPGPLVYVIVLLVIGALVWYFKFRKKSEAKSKA
ncbi:hypothetical protein HY990_00400 [Candidatus Micrarchaeota archaeon]|nr:hypothetical protein [Candidatus Micrarchaeota archaeon]